MVSVEESAAEDRREDPFGGVGTPIERFVAVAEERADQTAILEDTDSGSTGLTYGELDEMASRIGNGIRRLGGDQVTTVAILTEDTVAHIAAVLGAMKTGVTAVPLHPSNPQARLEYIVEHSGAQLVIADSASLERSRSLGSASAMAVAECAAESSEQLQVALDPEATARIMYTSGSTGAPKGVMQSHRYMLRKTWAETGFYEFGTEDRLSQLFPLSFAASTSHTFGALLNGGILCPYDVSTQGMHHLTEWIQDVRITGLGMVPTLFRRLLEAHEDASPFETIRYVFLGGELVLRTDVELYRRLFPDSSVLVHRLASTETGAITRFVIDKETVLPEAVVPAGYPAEGKEVVIVDDAGEPVSDGEVGELWVRSDNLATGYWNDRELTEQTFVVDEDDPQARIFRTGDVAMRTHGGLVVHLGRKDGRVKIRGFGVDLVEVERTLLAIEGVTEGAVILVESGGENQLAAYFVGDAALDSSEMRHRFLEAVPDYMVPVSFVRLERLPLTPRGKIDRAALAAVEAVPDSAGQYVAPASELEEQLHSLWCDNLGVERVSVVDSFFDIGGTSIAAYQLVSDIYRELDADLPATSLLEAPTIRAQAALIAAGGPTSRRAVVPIRATGSKTPLFGLPGGGGGVLYLQKLAGHIDEERPIYALPRDMSLAETPEYSTVEEMAVAHLAEMRSIQPTGPYLLLGSCFGGQVAYTMARMLHENGERVDLLVTVDPPTLGWEGHSHWKFRPWTWEFVRGWTRRKIIRIVRSRKRRRQVESGEVDRRHELLEFSRRANRDYTPTPSPVPMVVLAARRSKPRQEWYWTPLAVGGLEVEEFKFDHTEMYGPQGRRVIAKMLDRHLDNVDAAQPH